MVNHFALCVSALVGEWLTPWNEVTIVDLHGRRSLSRGTTTLICPERGNEEYPKRKKTLEQAGLSSTADLFVGQVALAHIHLIYKPS